ncbi:MAG: hypothetical protein AAB368_09325, partial [bacterium]
LHQKLVNKYGEDSGKWPANDPEVLSLQEMAGESFERFDPTQYGPDSDHNLTLPGGSNYREVLVD